MQHLSAHDHTSVMQAIYHREAVDATFAVRTEEYLRRVLDDRTLTARPAAQYVKVFSTAGIATTAAQAFPSNGRVIVRLDFAEAATYHEHPGVKQTEDKAFPTAVYLTDASAVLVAVELTREALKKINA